MMMNFNSIFFLTSFFYIISKFIQRYFKYVVPILNNYRHIYMSLEQILLTLKHCEVGKKCVEGVETTESVREIKEELEIRKRNKAWKKKYDELYLGMLMPNERHKQRVKSKKLKEDVYKCDNAWHTEPHLESLNGRDDWLVEQIEYGECSICGHELLVEDYERGELVCEGCGTVQGTQVYERNRVHATLEALPNNDQIRKEEWQVIFLERRRTARLESTKEKQVHAKKPQHRTDMKTYRRNQYLLALNSISSQLHMTQHQTDAVKNIILDDRYKMRDFHGNAGYRAVIAGLCRFVLNNAGRGNELRYTRAVFKENKLDEKKYKVIAMNIIERRILSLMK